MRSSGIARTVALAAAAVMMVNFNAVAAEKLYGVVLTTMNAVGTAAPGTKAEKEIDFNPFAQEVPREWAAAASETARYELQLTASVGDIGYCHYSSGKKLQFSRLRLAAVLLDRSAGDSRARGEWVSNRRGSCSDYRGFHPSVHTTIVYYMPSLHHFTEWLFANLAVPDLPAPPKLIQPLKSLGRNLHVSLNPDGQSIAQIAADGNSVELRRLGGDAIRVFQGEDRDLSAVVFSIDGRRIGTGSRNGMARLWDVETGAELISFKGHGGSVWRIVLSPDGKRAATTGEDNKIRIWDAASGRLLKTVSAQSHKELAFNPQGTKILASNRYDHMEIDVESGKELLTLKEMIVSYRSDWKEVAVLRNGSVRFFPRVESASPTEQSKQAFTRKYDIPKGLVGFARPSLDGMGYMPDDRHLWFQTRNGIEVVNATNGHEVARLRFQSLVDEHGMTSIKFSPDGRTLVTIGINETLLWELPTLQ